MTDSNNVPPNAPPQTAIATVDASAIARQERAIQLREGIGNGVPHAIVPRTFAEAQSFAGALAHSSLINAALRERAPDLLVMLLAGAELGFAPMTALRSFHVIEGLPRLTADALAAVVTASPACERFAVVSMSSERVEWVAKRRGHDAVTNVWTIDDANRAGLNGKTWQKYPKAMLNARCKAELARLVFPEIAAGLLTVEEFDQDGNGISNGTSIPAAAFAAPPPPLVATVVAPAGPPPGVTTAAEVKKTAPAKKKEAPPVIDAASSETKTEPAKFDQEKANADAFAKAAAASRAADEARNAQAIAQQAAKDAEAKAALDAAEIAKASAAPTVDDSGFGDDSSSEVEKTPEETFALFCTEMAETKKETLEAAKKKWLPWCAPGAPGHAYAARMREVYAKRRADLGA